MSGDAELAPVRAGDALDWGVLEDWLRAHVQDIPADPMAVLQFPRGHANLTYLLNFGDVKLVLRRPPHGKAAPGAHDMEREYKVLSRLWRAYPRAPRAYAFCDDASVIGSRFVVQEYRAGGEVIFKDVPDAMRSVPDLGQRLTVALVDTLVDLHKVDYAAIGLADFGQPEGFLERQLSGWRDRWRRVSGAQAVPEMDALAYHLERAVPKPLITAIVHNDFKLDNCQFRAGSPDHVVSLFDWDMATIGDPLVDVGIALDYWHYTRQNSALHVPPKEVFAQLYADRMSIDVAVLGWYEGFASWRSGVAIQQLYHRYAQGDSQDERMKNLGQLVPQFAARGKAALAHGN